MTKPFTESCLAALLIVGLVATGCYAGGGETAPTSRAVTGAAAADQATLTGSGSTFVEPLLRAWIDRYRAVAPGVDIRFEASGSPAAIEALEAGEGDFYASDAPLSELEEATLGGSHGYLQVPWAAGAIAIAFNLPDVTELRLRPDTLAAIFSGKLVRWDDPAIRADNDGARLPSLPVQVVHRSDPSGTTQVFSRFMDAAAGASWGLGTGRTIRFPRGQGVEGSSGVVSAVRRTSGAVGYVGLSHARAASVSVVSLGNRAGAFQPPSPDAVGAALDAGSLRPFDTVVRLNFRPDAPGAYPLATVSYLILRRTGQEPAKAKALRHFASWAMTEGQRIAEALGYTLVPRQYRVAALTAVEGRTPG